MATINFAGNTYAGEVLEDLLVYTAKGNETYEAGLVHVKPGIQKRYVLPHIQLGSIIQDNVPTPTTTQGSANDSTGFNQYKLSERYLDPQDFMVYLEFNPRDFEQYYKPFQPKGNLVFRELDPKVQATMIRLLMEQEQEYINQAIWCSATAAERAKISSSDGSVAAGATEIGGDADAGPMKYFNGAIARVLMNAAAAATSEDAKCGQVNIAGTGTFADGEAVEKELYAMWEATAPKIRKKAGLVILMDYKSWDAYNRYLSAKTVKYSDNRSENEHRFQGKRIIPMVALPNDTILMGVFTTGVDSNLWMGVDYANDENVLQVDKLQNNSELYFFKVLLKMDVNIVRPSEITAHIPFKYTAA